MKLEHIGIAVSAPMDIARWYREQLGCKIIRKSGDNGEGGAFVLDESGNTILEFFRLKSTEPLAVKSSSPLQLHVAFESEDPWKTAERLVENGAKILSRKPEDDADPVMVLLSDPWGLSLQLIRRREKLVAE